MAHQTSAETPRAVRIVLALMNSDAGAWSMLFSLLMLIDWIRRRFASA
jgi:hypothetical protein